MFDSISDAQQQVDAWLVEYNTDRPHASLGRRTPAEVFNRRELDAGPAVKVDQPLLRRDGDGWISRRVASNGIISVAWQQVSVGKYRAGEIVDVHVHVRDGLLEVWSANELVRTVVRDNERGIGKKRASRPAQT